MSAHSPDSAHQGSFLNGFLAGLFAGAAGYFLFGTKKGETVRSKVEQEWNTAKEHLAQKGVIESADMSIRDFFSHFFEKFDLHTQKGSASKVSANQKPKPATKSKSVKPRSKSDEDAASTPKKRIFRNA